MLCLSRALKNLRVNSAIRYFSTAPEMIKVEKKDKICLITLNRPKAMNSLCSQLITELSAELKQCDEDPEVRAIVITGSKKFFAAGADIKEMEERTYQENFAQNYLTNWFNVAATRKPTIAAVNGYALGGGCELAMMCDIILAGDKAQFGQPEIKLGTIPGAGGTQRLVKAIGKSRAMELVLTGDFMGAQEAQQRGLVSRVVAEDNLVEEAMNVAKKIAGYSLPMVMMAKECVNQSFETTLATGLLYERRMFHSTFAYFDRREGMSSFLNKKKPEFKDS
ncbi:unnamed protein product [Blepharisma stoltei]|uniref:Probable enoyl-CoA hydratase, mitochondrial n=1 Tax=Blepharisma stoltei TaxID=1481888 RepID=A0AAU9J6M1_9CILI|nr:unnamed protein product [Blepharisma stoltei]